MTARGAEAKDGDKVKVNYTGRLLKTNFMFDTSIGPGKKPFPVTIGKGSVLDGGPTLCHAGTVRKRVHAATFICCFLCSRRSSMFR